MAVVEQVLGLYRERYFDLSVRHFHEKPREEHGLTYSYTWVKLLLQGAGLVAKARQHGIQTVEEASGFLRGSYLAEFNRKFRVAPRQPESAFVPAGGKDLDRIFSLQHERVVNRDNTISFANRVLQIERTKWRGTLAGCRVLVSEHLDGRISSTTDRIGWQSSEPNRATETRR